MRLSQAYYKLVSRYHRANTQDTKLSQAIDTVYPEIPLDGAHEKVNMTYEMKDLANGKQKKLAESSLSSRSKNPFFLMMSKQTKKNFLEKRSKGIFFYNIELELGK